MEGIKLQSNIKAELDERNDHRYFIKSHSPIIIVAIVVAITICAIIA